MRLYELKTHRLMSEMVMTNHRVGLRIPVERRRRGELEASGYMWRGGDGES